MHVEQTHLHPDQGWSAPATLDADWAVVFAGSRAIRQPGLAAALAARYPRAAILGCSTAGEVLGTTVHDDTVVVTAVRFARSRARLAVAELGADDGSYEAGLALGQSLAADDLVHVLVLSDGSAVNGSRLAAGLVDGLPATVSLTGGLAGDGARMTETAVLANGAVGPRRIAALGLYGRALRVGWGTLGGWDPFGPERVITRSAANVLYALDDQPALALYRRYLGEHARDLPTAGLRFPLAVRSPDGAPPVVRTLLGIDEEAGSITFAGDMPEGHLARLMRANFDRLIEGAAGAARQCVERIGPGAELALVVSCVGRRLVLDQRIEEELDGVREILGAAPIAGFYSNGELSPHGLASCALHNQTMTVTTLSEA